MLTSVVLIGGELYHRQEGRPDAQIVATELLPGKTGEWRLKLATGETVDHTCDAKVSNSGIWAALDRMPNIEEMTPLPVAGYTSQPEGNVTIVNEHKEAEERLLRRIDDLLKRCVADPRWAAIAKSHFEQGFMALNRSVFQPERIALPEDATGA